MDKDDFYSQTLIMLKDIDLALTAYGIDEELSGHEATKLWIELGKLHKRMGEVKNKAQANDPAFQD